MPFQVMTNASDVSEDLAFFPDLEEAWVAESFGKKRLSEAFDVPRVD